MKIFNFILLIATLMSLAPPTVLAKNLQKGKSKLISLSVKQSNISELFEMLSRQNNINILLANDIDGKVSINLYDISVKEAIYAIASASNLAVERLGNGYLISKRDRVGKTIPGGLTDIRTYKVQYSDSIKVADILKKHLSQYGKIDLLEDRNLLVVEDLPDFLDYIEKLLQQLDQAPAQILIEAKILSITLNDRTKDMASIGPQTFNTTDGKGSFGGNNLEDQLLDLAIGGAVGGPAGMFFNYFTKNIEVQLNLLSQNKRVRTLFQSKVTCS